MAMFCAACDSKNSSTPEASRKVADKTVLLATIADEKGLQSVAPSLGMGLHAPQVPSIQPVFNMLGGAVAYRVALDAKAYVVHNGRSGKHYDAVGSIALSPDGSRIAYGALLDGKWRMVIDGAEGAAFSAVKAPLFSPDGRHLAYQAMSGEKWFLVVDATANAGTDTRFLSHQFSGDSRKIAYLDNADDYNRKGRLVVSDLNFTRTTVISPSASGMVLNPEGTRIAAISGSGAKQQMVVCDFDRPDAVQAGSPYDLIRNPGFGPGLSLAYYAESAGTPLLVLDGREEVLPAGAKLAEAPVVRPDGNGAGALIAVGNQVHYQTFFEGSKKENSYDEADGLTYSRDGRQHAYAARRGDSWFVVINGTEGAGFDRVISPKFSPNGKYLVYRARKEGKRFVVVANRSGKTIRQHPSYEQVFDVMFTAGGKSIAYGVKDGNKLVWQVETL